MKHQFFDHGAHGKKMAADLPIIIIAFVVCHNVSINHPFKKWAYSRETYHYRQLFASVSEVLLPMRLPCWARHQA